MVRCQAGGQGQVLHGKYNAESPKQYSKRFNCQVRRNTLPIWVWLIYADSRQRTHSFSKEKRKSHKFTFYAEYFDFFLCFSNSVLEKKESMRVSCLYSPPPHGRGKVLHSPPPREYLHLSGQTELWIAVTRTVQMYTAEDFYIKNRKFISDKK